MSTIGLLIIFYSFLSPGSASVSMHVPFYCYSKDVQKPQLKMFGTKEAYDIIRGQHIDSKVSNCTPSRFWIVTRHGTRLPAKKDLEQIFKYSEKLQKEVLLNYEAGKTSLCASDAELIRKWKLNPNITYENAQYLTVSGWNEIQGIAQRYQAAFPTLLPASYARDNYSFQSTSDQRTIASGRAFADGLFGHNGFQQVTFDNISNPNYLLHANYFCKLYDTSLMQKLERDAFIEGPEFQEMIFQVSNKLGFIGSHILSAIEIDTLSKLCRMEQIWEMNSTSPFCASFSIANHEVLEYLRDLTHYYKAGYGNKTNRNLFENMNCHLMRDLLSFVQSNDVNKARILISHETVLELLLVTLGAFEDEIPLTRHNFAHQTARLWRTSLILPMAANLVVVRFDCADDGENDLLFLLNEKPLQIAGCQSNGLCKQSLILQRFSRFLDGDCMKLYCNGSESGKM